MEEESLRGSRVGLDGFTVHRPVQMGNKTGTPGTGSDMPVTLSNGVHVNVVVVGARGKVATIRRVLYLMDYLLTFLDDIQLSQVAKGRGGQQGITISTSKGA